MFEVLGVLVVFDGGFGEFFRFALLVEGLDDFGGLLGVVVLAFGVHDDWDCCQLYFIMFFILFVCMFGFGLIWNFNSQLIVCVAINNLM